MLGSMGQQPGMCDAGCVDVDREALRIGMPLVVLQPGLPAPLAR
ncbi:MAG TPA: hypothetical protein VFU49_02620 [Ktedonobacteraceae bacterium]|nr:hypothetical protein [Ktedonobacteraceae bacterium]